MSVVHARNAILWTMMLSGVAPAAAQDVIVVTGERREQDASTVVQSVTVLGAGELKRINADHIAEAMARAPGVNLHRGSGAEHLTAIRSPVLTGGAGAGSFLFLENGVPIRSPGFANTNGLFDAHYEIADAIEVVRGPSGPLYGANAIHGVINVLSPAPSASSSVFAEIYGDTQTRFKAKASVSETSGAHGLFLGASIVSEEGYRDDASLDQQKLTIRHIYDAGGAKIDSILSIDNLQQETAGFIFGRDALLDPVERRKNEFPFAYRDARSVRLQSTLATQIASNIEIRVTPYGRWNEMEFPQHFLPSNALEENSHWSLGMQSGIYVGVDSFSFIAGADVEYTEGDLREFQSLPTIFSYTQGLHYDFDVRALNLSGFVNGEYQLGPRTFVAAAMRIDSTDYIYENNTDSGVAGRFLRPESRNDNFVTTSPKFSLRHEFSDDATGYMSYARGARPPQTTDLYRLQINQTGGGARPETIDAFEIGLRTRLAQGVSIDVAAYWMEKRNFFFRDADGFNVSNGKTRHAGVEADVEIVLTESLTFKSAMTYAAHTYRFDRTTSNRFESIRSGDDVDTAPRIFANTQLQWRPSPGISLEAEWIALGPYFTDAANAHRYEGHHLLNLRTEAKVAGGVSAYVALRNVTNELYAERADFAFGEDRYFPGETRTLGVGLQYSR